MKINLFIVFLLCFNLGMTQHWTVMEMSNMPERVSNSAVAHAQLGEIDYVYCFAGIDSTKIWSGIHLKSFRYNVQQDIWERIPSLPDNRGKVAASADRVGDVIYIIGGYYVNSDGSEKSSNRVHRYDVYNNTYLSDGTIIPVPIDDQVQAVWRDSLIYVITGWSDNTNVQNVQIYNPTENSWTWGTAIPNTNSYKSFGATGSIVGDTIYYFGGARSIGNFGIQNELRIGIIDPNDPTKIDWSISELDPDLVGYRMASTVSNNQVFWLGGSDNTYNYDGIAYDGSGPVEPNNRSLIYDPSSALFQLDFSNELPMDLRGLGSVNDSIKYIVGGMMSDQWVSNKTFRLEKLPASLSIKDLIDFDISILPNPADHFISVNTKDLLSFDFVIRDLKGLPVQEGSANSQDKIGIHHLQKGVYFIELRAKNNLVAVKKFVMN